MRLYGGYGSEELMGWQRGSQRIEAVGDVRREVGGGRRDEGEGGGGGGGRCRVGVREARISRVEVGPLLGNRD